jgi:hypothetical protein
MISDHELLNVAGETAVITALTRRPAVPVNERPQALRRG